MNPQKIRVGPATYRVIRAAIKGKYGKCHHMSATITMHDEMAETHARDTLLHEALHAVLFVASAAEVLETWTPDFEEKLVRLMAPWVLGVIRDNPDLIAYLTE